MNEVKVTGKMELAINTVKVLGGKAFAREVLNYLDANQADRAELKTFNSVNATLAYAAKAGIVASAKAVFNDKMLTQYTVATDEVEAEIDEVEVDEADADETDLEDAE